LEIWGNTGKNGTEIRGRVLRAREARKFLLSLKVKKEINQHEVEKAVKKIDSKILKPFWRK
jgi:transcription termination factor Rho